MDKYRPKPKLVKPKTVWLDAQSIETWDRLKAEGYAVVDMVRDAIRECLELSKREKAS